MEAAWRLWVAGITLQSLIVGCLLLWPTLKIIRLKYSADGLFLGDVITPGRRSVFKGDKRQETINTILYGNSSVSLSNNSSIKLAAGDRIFLRSRT